ncbi:FxLYD domain-containing protein [Metabacillus arenae]|uniref:Zinc ribbon domain-containing protein n=1 Tax=Metabacillus arenae TaxID=2771434 RepID=A0A926RYC6_9BACI|nr:zinc ribbon domain-containing protein [Metabacillus arenae]MBD1381590.1 zinc ribbon domain-containing protein [Metabacillus arenae]
MSCHNCGSTNIHEGARFCPFCGTRLKNEINRKHLIKYISLPVASFVIVTFLVVLGYKHEENVNAQVVDQQRKAEELALSGRYEEALSLLEAAKKDRTDYSVLKKEMDHIEFAQDISEQINDVNDHIKNTEFEEARTQIKTISKQLQGENTVLLSPLKANFQESSTNVTVGEIKKEINTLNSIDLLSDKLKSIAYLDNVEAAKVENQIVTRMVELSTKQAEDKLSRNHFNEASYIIEEALQYAVNNEKLISLKEKIEQERESFLVAERVRIEKAISAAKKEEEKNKNKAVEVKKLNVKLDDFGDAYIEGEVINNGTRDINSVVVEFIIKDKQGKEIEKGKTNIFPNTLHPNETGKLKHIVYGVKKDIKMEIRNMNWYLSEKEGSPDE